MKELEDIVKAWRRTPAGAPLVLATVVSTSGSTYRKAGAKMLLSDKAWIAGSVSGGCLESELVQSAWQLTENGPAIQTFDASAEEDILWGFGLGCNGIVRVFIERIDETGGPLAYIEQCLLERRQGTVSTNLEPGPQFGEHTFGDPIPSEALFLDVVTLPVELVLCGSGHDVVPLATLGKALGWRVVIVDKKRPSAADDSLEMCDERIVCAGEGDVGKAPFNEGSAVVLMSHNYLQDKMLLRAALNSQASYIGLLGPKRRADRLLQDLRAEGCEFEPRAMQRLHAPIGLDLGAESPDEIALAIASEIQAFLRGRRPTFLRDSDSPLHRTAVAQAPEGEPSRV